MELDLESATHCERDGGGENCGIEITPEMIEVGEDVILSHLGGRDLFLFFSAVELAERVYRAMREMEN